MIQKFQFFIQKRYGRKGARKSCFALKELEVISQIVHYLAISMCGKIFHKSAIATFQSVDQSAKWPLATQQ